MIIIFILVVQIVLLLSILLIFNNPMILVSGENEKSPLQKLRDEHNLIFKCLENLTEEVNKLRNEINRQNIPNL